MKKPRRQRRPHPGSDDASYTCPTCGESIVIPLDPSAGPAQEYTEDCPVCCHPHIIHVAFDPALDEPRVWAEAE
jgi:predicted RNA-binding Zn-ribbon protein involved in translation (DUF1610 family)